jgi:hypothetical protein
VTIEECLHITQPFLGCWAILSASEWLANSELFGSRGFLAWPILRLRVGMTARFGDESRLGRRDAFTLAQIIRLLAGVSLLLWYTPRISATALFVLVCTCAYTNFRACFGGDGSDQMGLIVAVGALMMASGLAIQDTEGAYAGVILVSGQALLAYFVAGVSKLFSPVWRSGSAVVGVMQTETFGNIWAARVTSDAPTLSYVVGWSVIVTVAIFHFINAYVMGLNSFVVSFFAVYPSVVKINLDLRSVL